MESSRVIVGSPPVVLGPEEKAGLLLVCILAALPLSITENNTFFCQGGHASIRGHAKGTGESHQAAGHAEVKTS